MDSCLAWIIQGMIIGVFMLVPGVSGGSIAILLGIYDKLLDSVAGFFSEIKNNFKFLGCITIGALLGFALMSRLISYLLEVAYLQTIYLFIGIIVGGLWNTFQEQGGLKRLRIVPLLLGVIFSVLLKFLPNNLMHFQGQMVVLRFLLYLISGVVLAAALILPGISFSMMLLSLGLYNDFVKAITRFDILFLIPIGLCVIFGIIVSSKILATFLKKAPDSCHSMIDGFVIVSVMDMFASVKNYSGVEFGVFLLILGTVFSNFGCKFLNKKRA